MKAILVVASEPADATDASVTATAARAANTVTFAFITLLSLDDRARRSVAVGAEAGLRAR
jgi:hypothetical protein